MDRQSSDTRCTRQGKNHAPQIYTFGLATETDIDEILIGNQETLDVRPLLSEKLPARESSGYSPGSLAVFLGKYPLLSCAIARQVLRRAHFGASYCKWNRSQLPGKKHRL